MSSINNKKSIKAGAIILQQGEEGNSAYIIESGTVEILIEKEQGLIQSLGTRSEGTLIGEMSLVDNKPRTATIKALEDCVLLEITRNDFNHRLENSDPIVQMVIQVILARYRDMITRAHILGRRDDQPLPDELEKNLVEKANAVTNIKITNELKEAIQNNDLEIHYQPIIDLQANKIAGFEALIRWKHHEKGNIPPDVFIPIAEESGLIIDISRFVVKDACAALTRMEKARVSSDPFFMSVNFSAKDFTTPDFKNYVENILAQNNLSHNQLHIEITERLLMEEPSLARKTLEQCKEAGIPISIDDFGTGYSSLSYLHYFPIDILKIDRSFIENMEHDKTAFELAKSIISLGHNMKMSIIAEGIEEETQANMLIEMGVDKAQGFYFARPMPEADLLDYISRNEPKA